MLAGKEETAAAENKFRRGWGREKRAERVISE